MPPTGSSRSSPLSLSGGPYTPAQRAQLERQYISTLYSGDFGQGWTWQWVETRTFPDNGHTYDVVGFMTPSPGDPRIGINNQLWFDVTNTLTTAEASPLVQRAATVPVANAVNSAGLIKPAGQALPDGTIPLLIVAGVLGGFMFIEYATRPPERSMSPSKPKRRRSVKLSA